MSRDFEVRHPDTLTKLELAQILEVVARIQHPKLELGNVAVNHHLRVDDLHRIIRRHGYPDKRRLLAAGRRILDEATLEATNGRAEHEAGRPLMVPIGRVLPGGENPREKLQGLDELADSFTAVGMLQPIVVRRRGDNFVIVAGHRRRAAAGLLGWTEVPVVLADVRPDDVLVAMLVENGQREDLDPIEEARALERVRVRGDEPLTHGQLGALIGRSQPYVSTRLALLELNPEDQAAVRAGHMAIRDAADVARQITGRGRGMKGKKSAAHFTDFHPLAPTARDLCRANNHHKNTAGGKLGGVACGQCWEVAIRSDEANKIERRRTPPVCTDPDCTIPRRPGFPPHGPHDFRARTARPATPPTPGANVSGSTTKEEAQP